MTAPFTDEYHDGDMVRCQRCAKNVRVKYYDRDTVVVVSTQEQQTLALRCQYCGYVLCDSCAHPADSLFPVCPSCQREWGPYYFTHEAISPSSSKPAQTEDILPAPRPQAPVELPFVEAPPAPAESLGAGETDLYGEYRDWEHKKGLRKILALVLAIIIIGLLIGLALGPGKPLVKKGFALISSRPTHTPTGVSVLQNPSTTEGVLPTKTLPPTSRVTSTPIQPNSTLATLIETKPIIKATVTPEPTHTKPAIPSSTATAMPEPTSTATFEPTPTATNPALGDCVPALSVTIDDVGKTLCVTGTVVFTLESGTTFSIFSIYFANEDGHFRIVIYDRVPKDIVKGVCIRATGEIKTLTGIPVMALGFNDVIEFCSP